MFWGGMWGSNPRLAEAQIRFRNLLYFSSLTIQFSTVFTPVWDIFGTLFAARGNRFFLIYLSVFQCVVNSSGNARGIHLGNGGSECP